ncbi:TetR/AcrR family transcriptional regulator [Rhizobium sp. BG4]|uniref:TetR/AcrR family transcriptional regulator n=1 Tax=Rhizobium sp. BG4 TaxID=2613770 RepID=UPI00193E5CA8|nr:TetR/AcrR family transcriptional regulator [Rhizobium sp. BG4]QRM46600.1 TetR/AcrR family transcriptional regulator [Rhizobium sp. BG4]
MDKTIKRRRGGPRTFDRAQAVDTAMHLFWRHGYEGVSLNDLTEAIGVAPPSIYSAFGSKAGLYREALDHYFGLPGALKDLGEKETLAETVDTLFVRAIDAVVDPAGERGCMISSGMLQTAAEHSDLAKELADRRNEMRLAIAGTLQRWLPEDRASSVARYILAVLQGLSVQARDGGTREELEDVTKVASAGVQAMIG